ncbi:peptidase M48 [Synergistales bacterium]|nr:peptidase M48 [Synergistales bacterium]
MIRIKTLFLAVFFTFLAFFTVTFFEPSLSMAATPKNVSGDAALDPDISREIEIGRKAVEEIEKRWELSSDPSQLARLAMITDALKPHMTRPIPYETRIIRSDIPNAFCLPGGFVFFTTKMLDLLHSDDEIAAVMAHEMVHVDQKHGMKMSAKSSKITLAALAVMLASGGAMAPIVLAQVAQVAITSGYTIEFEKEADSMGLDVLIASGYSPSAMVTVMEGFMHEELKQPQREYGIYMDHPESIERVKSMSEKLKSLRVRLERKIPLHLLLTSADTSSKRVRLSVDGAEVWGGEKSDAAIAALLRAKAVLDEHFQMELPPYDLRVESNALRLKNATIAQPPLPEDMQDLSAFREKLLAALARAQKTRPATRYF